MNFYTPNGHAAYATQQPPINNANNNHNNHDHTSSETLSQQQQQRVALQAALLTFDQLPAPSLREVLGAYRLKGDGDREMLLAILNAKAAEDQRMASMAQLHQTILQATHAQLAQNVLENQLAPLISPGDAGLGGGLGYNSGPHSHHPGTTPASSSPPIRTQLMSISSLIGEDGMDADTRSPRRHGSNNGSASGSRSPASVGTSGGDGRRPYHKTSSERSTS